MMAAIRGEPFDKYPFVNPYPFWSMMPHWPELNGLTFLHVSHGSDEQRLSCLRTLRETLDLDWLPIYGGQLGMDKRYAIEVDDGVPVLIDLEQDTRTRFEEFPKDRPVTEPRYNSAREVEALPPLVSAEEMPAGSGATRSAPAARRRGTPAPSACAGSTSSPAKSSPSLSRL